MELRHIRYFLALADELNFTRAAERVHIAQSTLSHQIKQLEDELGQTLFHRDGKRVTLTPSGELLTPSFRRALAEIDDGLRTLRAAVPDVEEEIAVVVASMMFNRIFVPRCLSAFMSDHPRINIRVDHLAVAALPSRLASGEMDFGVGDRPSDMRGLSFEPLYDEEMALFVSPSHPLASRKRLQLVELHRQNIVMLTRDRSVRQVVDGYFEAAGAKPNLVAELSSIDAVHELVSDGAVGTILSRSTFGEMPDLRVVRLEGPTPKRTIGFIWPQAVPPRPSVAALAGVIRRTVKASRDQRTRWPYIEPRMAGSSRTLN